MRSSSSALLPLLLAFGGLALLGGNKAAAAAPATPRRRSTSTGGAPSWVLLPHADTVQLDPARQYAALLTLPATLAAVASASALEDKLSERAEWAAVKVYDDPADLPESLAQAFAKADREPGLGRYWLFGRPKARKAIKAEYVTRMYTRDARGE